MSSYDFVPRNLFRTPTSINANCLQVLPIEAKKKLQKFVIGDAKNLQYWEYKKGELQKTFESEPASSNEISRVIISGQSDKASVFISAGS